ncbi:MAG: hypothetical protein WCJ25_02340 [Candidatus Moraniibacteriota bacterium]
MTMKREIYRLVSRNPESTVVAEYSALADRVRDRSYQSEAELERAFIDQLTT